MNNMIEPILQPIDRRRVWWRDYEPLPYPEPEPPDWERIQHDVNTTIGNKEFSYLVVWHQVTVSRTMSPQEAHFWLTHVFDPDILHKQISFAPHDYSGDMSVDMLRTLFAQKPQHNLPAWIVIPLHRLFAVKEYLPFLLDFTFAHYATSWSEAWLPYVTRKVRFTIKVAHGSMVACCVRR